jgi:hypothetical protein
VPVLVNVYRKVRLLVLMGLSKAAAPAGIWSDVVVCVPFTHVHLITSPTTAFTRFGVNWKLLT